MRVVKIFSGDYQDVLQRLLSRKKKRSKKIKSENYVLCLYIAQYTSNSDYLAAFSEKLSVKERINKVLQRMFAESTFLAEQLELLKVPENEILCIGGDSFFFAVPMRQKDRIHERITVLEQDESGPGRAPFRGLHFNLKLPEVHLS